MIRSILKVPNDIMDKIDFPNKPKAHDLKLMQDLCAILKPFEDATNASQGQNIITSSKIIIIIRTICEQLDLLSQDYNCHLLSTLKSSVDKRLSKYEALEEFRLASILDPHYKLDWCMNEEVESNKRILLKAAEEIHVSDQEDNGSLEEAEQPQP